MGSRSRWQRLRLIKNLQAQAQVNTGAASNPIPPNRDAKCPKLAAFVDEKDE